MEECGPCPVFASFALAFALQLRKKHGKNLSQGKKNQLKNEWSRIPPYAFIQREEQLHFLYVVSGSDKQKYEWS